MPDWFPWVLLIILIIVLIAVLAVAIILVFKGSALPHDDQPDPLPVRLGVLLLGAVVVLCVGGLMLVGSSPPQVAKDTTVETSQPKAQAAGGKTAESTTSSAVANTANLGLSGQIVGVFGTIAAAAVGGIAGLLAQARRQQ